MNKIIFIFPGTLSKQPALIEFHRNEIDALQTDIAFAEAQGDTETVERCRAAVDRHMCDLQLAQDILDNGVELVDGLDMTDSGQMVMEEAFA